MTLPYFRPPVPAPLGQSWHGGRGNFLWTSRRMHTPVMQQALAAAKEAAYRAGEVILSYYSSHYEVQSKGVDNPVTTADLAANHVLHETLLGAFPEAGWLSEESADDAARLQHHYVWIIDPIDGTKEFIQGIDEFVVVVAFIVEQQVEVVVT